MVYCAFCDESQYLEFVEDFKSRTKYTTSTKKKNLIRYILARLEERDYPEQVAERPIDNSISIEHILPQKPEEHWGLTEEEVESYVHLIGNLVLVGIDFNVSARNYELERKIFELRETGIRTTVDLLFEIEQESPPIWTKQEIENIASNSERIHFRKDQYIIKQNDIGDSLFIIADGVVNVTIDNNKGEKVMISKLGVGDFFGEMSLMTGEPRTANIIAEIPCVVLKVSKDTIKNIDV